VAVDWAFTAMPNIIERIKSRDTFFINVPPKNV